MTENSGLKRLMSYVAVFVIGFGLCAYILKVSQPGVGTSVINAEPPSHASAIPMSKGSNPVVAAAAKIEKYVVNIDTVGRPQTYGNRGFGGFFPFERPQEVVKKGQASGVVISSDGYVLTNNHVVANTSKVAVTLWNKKQYPATIIGRDPKTDLAVIKIDARGLDAAVPANSADLRVGDWVIAVGNPLGLGTTVTVGVVSATERENLSIEGTVLEKAIQTDASINLGNSGGALADIDGKLVGINTAIASTNPGGGSIGIGFAIPSNTAMTIARQIIEHGKVVRPWIGIMYMELTDEIRQELKDRGEVNLPPVNGALIKEVVQGSPADRAGLMPLDVITEINGKKVESASVVANLVSGAKVGQIVDLVVWHARTGKSSRIAVRLGEMPLNPQQ